jgi:hypothetical protein
MRHSRWLWMMALIWFSGGCCTHPGLFQKLQDAMATVQRFYDPLVAEALNHHEAVQQAVVAADTTLLLAAELQQQWCPNPDKAEQVALQAQEAQKLAQGAGVIEAGASGKQISRKSTE